METGAIGSTPPDVQQHVVLVPSLPTDSVTTRQKASMETTVRETAHKFLIAFYKTVPVGLYSYLFF